MKTIYLSNRNTEAVRRTRLILNQIGVTYREMDTGHHTVIAQIGERVITWGGYRPSMIEEHIAAVPAPETPPAKKSAPSTGDLAAAEYADYADIAAAWAEAHQRTGSDLSRIKRDVALAHCAAALSRIENR